MSAKIRIPNDQVAAFCRRNRIHRLSLFGSVLRGDFTENSDIDILVEIEPDHPVGLMDIAGMEIELSEILGRRAEIHTIIHTIPGLNPRFRDEVLEMVEVQYEQA